MDIERVGLSSKSSKKKNSKASINIWFAQPQIARGPRNNQGRGRIDVTSNCWYSADILQFAPGILSYPCEKDERCITPVFDSDASSFLCSVRAFSWSVEGIYQFDYRISTRLPDS
jgi:hypothetical protein